MECRIVAKYKGAFAHYTVLLDQNNTYHAQLLRYDGRPIYAPPAAITFEKGAQELPVSYEKQILIKEIENLINKRMKRVNA